MVTWKIKRGAPAFGVLCGLYAGEGVAGEGVAGEVMAAEIMAAEIAGAEVSAAADVAGAGISTGEVAAGEPPAAAPAPADEGAGIAAGVLPVTHTGFETGLRVGAGLPLGDVGEDVLGQQRQLEDLTTWRAPFWVDFGYRFSDTTTLGAYFQVGIGGNGDACAGACDWQDLRAGLHGQWRLTSGGSVTPWLGAGIGYEALEFRTLVVVEVADEQGELQGVPVRVSETLGGPELLLQGGLDFKMENSLWIGPFVTATLGQYLSNDFECDPDGISCPARDSFEGKGLHSWVTVGLRGSYLP